MPSFDHPHHLKFGEPCQGSVWTCQQWIQQPHCWLFKCFQYFYKSCLWSVRAWTLMALIWLLAMSLSCNFNFEIKDKKCEESNALGLFPFFFNQFLFFLFCSALLYQIRQLRSSRGFLWVFLITIRFYSHNVAAEIKFWDLKMVLAPHALAVKWDLVTNSFLWSRKMMDIYPICSLILRITRRTGWSLLF